MTSFLVTLHVLLYLTACYTLCSLPWNDAPMKELFLNNAAMRVVFVYILWLVEFGLANPAIYL